MEGLDLSIPEHLLDFELPELEDLDLAPFDPAALLADVPDFT